MLKCAKISNLYVLNTKKTFILLFDFVLPIFKSFQKSRKIALFELSLFVVQMGTCGINLPSTSKIQVVLCFFFQVKVQVQVIGEYIFTKYKYKYVANTFQLLFNYFSNTFNK